MSGKNTDEMPATATVDNSVVSLDIGELCQVIDYEVDSIKIESTSTESTPNSGTKEDKSIKMGCFSPTVSSEPAAVARKRPSEEEILDVLKKPKLNSSSCNDSINESSEMDQALDIWDEDPKGLYGLSPQFLKSRGIRTPLTNWVHLSNVPCDKTTLREVMELAGNVLVCHVVWTKTGYAKVKYSHPIEAAQAVSMLNGQTLVGKTLSVSIDPGPYLEFLPVGLKKLGPGFSRDGKPLKDVVRHIQRHTQGKPTPLSDALFGADDVKTDDENKSESSETANKSTATDPVTPKITKEKIIQTDDNGNRNLFETVDAIKKKGVSMYEIIKALKALMPQDKADTNEPSKTSSSESKVRSKISPSKEKPSSRSNSNSRKPPSRLSTRSVSPKRTPYSSNIGPRSGSSGNFRQNAPNNFNNAGPRTDGPRMKNKPNFGPGNANFGPGGKSGPFNNFGPQGPSGPRAGGPFFQQGGPGPIGPAGPTGTFVGNTGPSGPFVGNSGPGPFGGNSAPGQFGGNSGPAHFGGNSGPAPFGGNAGPAPFAGNSAPGSFGGNSGPGPFGGNSGPGPFAGNSGPAGPSGQPGQNQQFGGNFGAIGTPRQNMMGSSVSNEQRSTSNVVILSNLPPAVTYQLLTDKMNQCGVVQFLNMTKPGCAMVRYASDWEAERCINTFDKTVVDGHQIEVRFA